MADREGSRDREMVLRSQHSWSSDGKASVPMWDSSDPDRAPPPLPINPGLAQSPTTRPNASAGIAAAARSLVEKARDSAPVSSYRTNETPQISQERSLIKGAQHKRMQSLQSASVRDLRSYLDGQRSPEKSPERPASRGSTTPYSRTDAKDYLGSSPDKSPERASTPTPASRDLLKETPTLRPTTRQPPRAILGENTPPSATMLALQTMRVPGDDQPFNDITNSAPIRSSITTGDSFSSQLLHLTTIATSLQREMAQLSRRSKDNATDLISLKEATNARDEDIRKSLKELVGSVNASAHGLLGLPPPPGGMSRSSSSFGLNGAHFLDSKSFNSPPSASKSYGLPTNPSALSFLESERAGSPNPYSVEGAASVAMLEKIIREMVTKEGQERLLSTLSELMDKSSKDNVEAAMKVEQLADFIKQKSESNALVIAKPGDAPPKLELNFDSPAGEILTTVSRGEGKEQKTRLDGEVMNLLKRIRDSVTTSGGMTAEVKTLVRDLRGEVLGMGRRLGEQLDKVNEAREGNIDRAIEAVQQQAPSPELPDVEGIIREGLAELKEHMQQMLSEHDSAAKAIVPAHPNGDEMYAVVKHALAEHGSELSLRQPEPEVHSAALDQEGILQAVKDACKDFEPNIELQQFGLERDEILQVLKEGLQDYQNSKPEPETGANMEEVHDAIRKALQDFQPPSLADQLGELREELLASVREALQEAGPGPVDNDASRAAVVEAVKETLASHGPNAPREIEISRDDLFDAVKASLDGTTIPFGGFGEQVLQQLHELIDGMRGEFKQYSAANGRDTEQVLDAVKDGLETLRAEVESYVDRAQDVTGKDEIVDTVKAGLEHLRGEVQTFVAQGPTGDNKVIEYIKAEFEHLHEAVGSRGLSGDGDEEVASSSKAELLIAMEGLKEHVSSRGMDDDATDEMLEAMKEEFEQLKAAITSATSCDKAEIIEQIQDSIGSLHAKLGGLGGSELSTESTGAILEAMREEFVHLRETLATTIIRSGEESADTDAIMAGVKTAIDDLRTQLTSDQSEQSAEALGAIKEELEVLKLSLGSSLVLGGASGTSDESLAAIRSALQDIHDTTARNTGLGMTDDMLEAIRGEFENLRTSIASTVVHGGNNNDDILDAVRLGLDDLRGHIEKKLENRELAMNLNSEVLDALNDGLENLKTEVVKTLDKPLDMTVNYEILDTLKDGLASLRSDMDRLRADKDGGRPLTPKGGEIVLADGSEGAISRDIPAVEISMPAAAAEGIERKDLEKMEVMLAQLQIKIEAMDATVQDLPVQQGPVPLAEGTAMRMDLLVLEEMLKDVQATLGVITGKEQAGPEGAARKEDTDAIETLLRNAKAQIDEIQVALPGADNAVNREHLDSVEAVVRVTNDAIDGLVGKIDSNLATKADVAVVEILAQDLKIALDELKEKTPAADPEEDENKMTKADLDVLGILCTEIKTKVNEMVLPDPETLPSKADIEQLVGLVHDFRESHDRMKDSYETDIAVTAKAFDDRKIEYDNTVHKIGDVKALLAQVKDELIFKITEGESGIDTLGETLKDIEENIGGGSDAVKADVKELRETVAREFERAHGSLEGMKVDHEQSSISVLEKHAEHKDAVVAEVSEKLESCFDGLMVKYDDAQQAAADNSKAMEEKVAAQEELMASTKEMADELRISIDTLGVSLTTFNGTFTDVTDKLAEDSKTVFNRVDDTYNKLDETQIGLMGEHQATREEMARAVAAVGGLQSDFTEYHPRFMVTLQEVLALVGKHYEHSKKAVESTPEHLQAIRDLQHQLRTVSDEGKQHAESMKGQTEELKSNLSSGLSSLPALMPPAATESDREVIAEKYDDSAVHEKLDKLVSQSASASNASSQLDRLDEIHEQVMATATEVSAFVALQARQITADHESKEKETEEVALLLERRQVQKDQIEAEITGLNEEKDSLRTAVEAITAEKEALAAQKARLSADVSSLETALAIRREELHSMDAKADQLERRVLEGIMNQSRAMLMAKSAKSPPKKPVRDLRIPSNMSAVSQDTVKSSAAPSLKANHALAMQSRPQVRRSGAMPNTAERRIMSLSQINNNVASGDQAFTSPTPSLISTGPQPLKRSHSVKTQYMRKPSWLGRRNLSLSAQNKENEISEESEGDLEPAESRAGADGYAGSDMGTERRSSYATNTATESGMTNGDGSYIDGVTPSIDDGRRASYGTSDLYGTGSYGTGSYLTGSELDRRTSLGSTVAGTVGARDAIEEEAVEDAETAHDDAEHDELHHPQTDGDFHPTAPPAAEMRKHDAYYAPPSDSGLGADLPTAALSATEGEYFGRGD